MKSTVEEAKCILSNNTKYTHTLKLVLTDLVDALKKNDTHKIFYDVVRDEDVPGYSDEIKEPMCLSMISNRIERSIYRDLDEFKADVSIAAHIIIKPFLFLINIEDRLVGLFDVCKLYQIHEKGIRVTSFATRNY